MDSPTPSVTLNWLLRNDGLRRIHAACVLIESSGAGCRVLACRLDLISGRVRFKLSEKVVLPRPWEWDALSSRWGVSSDDLPAAAVSRGRLVVVGITAENEFLIVNLAGLGRLSIHSVRALEVARAWALQLVLDEQLRAVTTDPQVTVTGEAAIEYLAPGTALPAGVQVLFVADDAGPAGPIPGATVIDRAPLDGDGSSFYLGADRSGDLFIGTAQFAVRRALVVAEAAWPTTALRQDSTAPDDVWSAAQPAVMSESVVIPVGSDDLGFTDQETVSAPRMRRRAQRPVGNGSAMPGVLGIDPKPAGQDYPPPIRVPAPTPEVDDDVRAAELLGNLGHIWVRVLGPIRIEIPGGDTLTARNKFDRPSRETELVTWMSLSPHGLSGFDVASLWPGDDPDDPAHNRKRNEFVSRLRKQLGPISPAAPDEQALLERERSGGANFRTHMAMLTDWAAFRTLVPGLPSQAGTAELAAALSLVSGRPFADAPPGRYEFSRLHFDVMLDACTDAAVELATRYVGADKYTYAFAAANRGVIVDTARQDLWRLVLSTAPYVHDDPGEIYKLIEQLKGFIPTRELEPETRNLIDRVKSIALQQ